MRSTICPTPPLLPQVRHDGTGRTSGWHLAWVRARNLTTGAVAMFQCGRWVDRRQHDDPPTVAVVVALPPDQAAAAGGQLSAKDRHLLPGGTGGGIKAYTTAATAAQAPVPQQGLRREAELEGSWGEVGVAETQGPPTGAAGYRVVFHTSRMCGSGTKARVHFELTGSRGSSGVLHPVGTSKSFGSGRMDVFDYPVSAVFRWAAGPCKHQPMQQLPCLPACHVTLPSHAPSRPHPVQALPFLGELQSARVGTNGSGFFPAWHLQLVVVTHLPTGRVWQFRCVGGQLGAIAHLLPPHAPASLDALGFPHTPSLSCPFPSCHPQLLQLDRQALPLLPLAHPRLRGGARGIPQHWRRHIRRQRRCQDHHRLA